MELYKDCNNCKLLLKKRDRITCEKNYFVKIAKQHFFHDPEADYNNDILYLNKYEAFARAIQCDSFHSVELKVIKNIEIEEPDETNRYENIKIEVELPRSTIKDTMIVTLHNISRGSKIYKWASECMARIYLPYYFGEDYENI